MHFFEAIHLTKKFNDKEIVKNVNLHVEKGQFIAFLGPNGAGKSTTVEMLIGLLTPTIGEISLEGIKVNSEKFRNKIGVVFQDSLLDRDLTVMENLKTRANLYQNFDSEYFNQIIIKLELEAILKQQYGVLSGGQRRRVDIARALIHQPELLFLDEPSTGLDIQTRNKIWQVLNEIRKTKQLTIILTTHYLEEVEYADYVYVLDHGEIIAENTLDNLKKEYAHDQLIIHFKGSSKFCDLIERNNQQIGQDLKLITNSNIEAINILDDLKNEISSFEMRPGSVNDIFLELTGKEIR
ncbi:hypothetical protein FC70_GL001492 [Paucilactobacillus oligofermentans DSM 15707 = LMG 22743]|uniref:ABC transporter domain-containing protein n=1 Tax=Paucilactobacillus oligofermentans DSM 15707 = LMG 22743 TaxID=1423778 RepID=A0A0R1RKH4_9LACO|nr:ABC transporter ATP-binding protein [Paucilactobacillus oligofermentans]KRL54693.1 hypothetical protein FC70_GL001492 [Paucilactobacillus oligofermentans DSM 15707 = LMG 22743]CUS26396.1 Daunorubicin resistance ABC transporter ATPase subunit [Paucilactobacillus oligofermentans DSM 15707 = LMG 22743]